MADKIQESVLKGAQEANKEFGQDPAGRKLLSDKRLGRTVLEKFEETERLKEEAVRDPLTGAYSRNHFEKVAKDMLRENKPFAVIFTDIDGFKEYNDRYGHPVGDAALKHLVAVVDNVIKVARVEGKEDLLVRWAGDEFLMLLRNVRELPQAVAIAERVGKQVKNSTFGGANGEKLKMTISQGVTVVKEGENLETLVNRADQALYDAKRTGRNKIATQR